MNKLFIIYILTFLTLDLLMYVIVIVNTTERSFTSDSMT